MAAKVALLDRVLALYGPETAEARRALRDATADGVRRTWPAERSGPVRLDPNPQMGDAVYAPISHLAPRDDAQRALKTEAANSSGATRRDSSAAASAGGSFGFKAVTDRAEIWLVVIFLGFSLLAPANATSTLALMLAPSRLPALFT